MSIITSIGAWYWLTDPKTSVVPLTESLLNHPIFTCATFLLSKLPPLIIQSKDNAYNSIYFFKYCFLLWAFISWWLHRKFWRLVHGRFWEILICPVTIPASWYWNHDQIISIEWTRRLAWHTNFVLFLTFAFVCTRRRNPEAVLCVYYFI